MRLWEIYHEDIPAILSEMSASPAMRRLTDVGMNCGCEYTSFPLFCRIEPYSRYDHSVGVALIIWHFTQDRAQAAAGLFHDIATPVFAHVVDFLRGDYLTQESTEDGTESAIAASPELSALLRKYDLTLPQVKDYHLYPVADNDTPRLSADRLEYTLGNMVSFGFAERSTAKAYYDDLTVSPAPDGQPELSFRTAETALSFAETALRCSRVYVSREDRYAMQRLSELVGAALKTGVLTEEDLYATERPVIEKLLARKDTAKEWRGFTSMHEIEARSEPGADPGWRQIHAKKRYIDPLVADRGRVSGIYPEFKNDLDSFLAADQNEWLIGK